MKATTRQKAINNHCKECVYDSHEPGTWLMQVEKCQLKTCALYKFRPLTLATKKRLKDERVAKMNQEELKKYKAKQEATRKRLQTNA